MILREVILSRDRHRLGSGAPAPDARPSVEIAPAPASARLTVTEVVAWLASEDESARRACAGVLAPELEELRATARADGFAAGQAGAIRETEARHAAALARLTAVAGAVKDASERAIEELANDCAAIVAEAFAKIAGDSLVSPAAAFGAVRAVLERVRDARQHTVYVHPSDLAAIEMERGNLQAALGIATLDIRTDVALSSGGCRVESDLGTLDGAFDVQLRALYDTLRAAHEQQTVLR